MAQRQDGVAIAKISRRFKRVLTRARSQSPDPLPTRVADIFANPAAATTGAGQVKVIRAIERHSAGTRQPNFLLLCADEFEVHIIIERYCLLSAKIVRHGFKQLLAADLQTSRWSLTGKR